MTIMRIIAIAALSLLPAACIVTPPPSSSNDPWLYDANGQFARPPAAPPQCREVERTVTIDGQPQQAHGTVCRQPDGTWRFGN
jgi:surface antigen